MDLYNNFLSEEEIEEKLGTVKMPIVYDMPQNKYKLLIMEMK